MAKTDNVEMDGIVTNHNRNVYTVAVNVPGKEEPMMVSCALSGKMRTNYIRVLENDRVTIQMSPYDMSKGYIIYRHK